MKSFLLIGLLTMSSCATVPLTAAEQSVRILRKSDAPANCKEMAKVHAPGLGSMTDQGRDDDLKRATVVVGGNTVTVDKVDDTRTIYGTAFNCN